VSELCIINIKIHNKIIDVCAVCDVIMQRFNYDRTSMIIHYELNEAPRKSTIMNIKHNITIFVHGALSDDNVLVFANVSNIDNHLVVSINCYAMSAA